jgi:hypothetical protein
VSTVASLSTRWRALAETLRAHAAEGAALAYERTADELDAALRLQADELLTLEEASAESGLTADHLGREVRNARIPNAGRKGAPRIRRADLPRKAGTLPRSSVAGHIDRDAIARAVITRHIGGA